VTELQISKRYISESDIDLPELIGSTKANNLPQVDDAREEKENSPEENENENENEKSNDHEPNWRDFISEFFNGPKTSNRKLLTARVLDERQSRFRSRRKYRDFPLNPEIMKFMCETVIMIDYSFQNLMNNVKSVWGRCQSTSIARLLNTRIMSNPVKGAKNYFKDIEFISLMCDHACASKLTKIYEQVTSNPLFARPLNAPAKREIPTITKMTQEILKSVQKGSLRSPQANEGSFSAGFYQAKIPFVEVIELWQRFMLFSIEEISKPGYREGISEHVTLTFYYENCVLKFS
jgi:hypothetical protein